MISVNGIVKKFGEFRAVDGISFTIRDGEITGLLGPNGAGKTTTLRMLTSYYIPDEGEVRVNDIRAAENPQEIKKIIGYLPESAPIYPDMIVYDYMRYIAEVRNLPESEKRIAEMAALCGIREVMHKNVGELSKGYKQRVGLAQSMVHDPDILILDEPTSGLDPNQIIEIRNLIRELGRKKTVILSTHILPEVEATCDRVIIINKGKIVADDSTEGLQASKGNENSISLKISGADYSSFAAELKRIPGVISVKEVRDDKLTSAVVKTPGSSELRPDIFKAVAAKGWVLYEMNQEQNSLENVFRELTRGGKNE